MTMTDIFGPATLDPAAATSALLTGPRPKGPTEGAPCLRCSFCGEDHEAVAFMVKGRGSTMICDGCVADAAKIIDAAREASLALPPVPADATSFVTRPLAAPQDEDAGRRARARVIP